MKKIIPFVVIIVLISLKGFAQESKGSDSLSIKKDSLTANDPSKKDTSVIIPASIPGGEMAYSQFMHKYLNPMAPLQHGAPPGKYIVWVSFTVNLDGSLSDVKADNDPGYGVSEESVNFIKKLPNWIPGTQNGKPIKTLGKKKITFIVNKD